MNQKSRSSSTPIIGLPLKSQQQEPRTPPDLLPPEIEGIIDELLAAKYNDVVEGTVDAAREIIRRYIR